MTTSATGNDKKTCNCIHITKRCVDLPYCPSCGKNLEEDARYCSNCGSDVSGERRSVDVEPRRRHREEREACFGPKGSGVGLWGSISGGVFLIGLLVLWYYDWFWPGILFLIALMAIIGGIVAYVRR